MRTPANTLIPFSRPARGKTECKRIPPSLPIWGSLVTDFLFLCAHIPAGLQIFELVKRDVELDLDVIAPRHTGRLDKLADKHFLGFKGASSV